jgi:hypothetical protein
MRRVFSKGAETMTEIKTYAGGCHCGKVRFEVQADLTRVIACNCSICSKVGWLLAFAPKAHFSLLSGEDALSDYQFNKKHIHHQFCSSCGVRSFSHGAAPDGQEMVAINVRCLEGVDLEALEVARFDGKSL